MSIRRQRAAKWRTGYPYRSGPSKAWLKTKNPTAPGARFRDEP
jgi:hypothetical protein